MRGHPASRPAQRGASLLLPSNWSSTISRLKQWPMTYSSVMPMPPCSWIACAPTKRPLRPDCALAIATARRASDCGRASTARPARACKRRARLLVRDQHVGQPMAQRLEARDRHAELAPLRAGSRASSCSASVHHAERLRAVGDDGVLCALRRCAGAAPPGRAEALAGVDHDSVEAAGRSRGCRRSGDSRGAAGPARRRVEQQQRDAARLGRRDEKAIGLRRRRRPSLAGPTAAARPLLGDAVSCGRADSCSAGTTRQPPSISAPSAARRGAVLVQPAAARAQPAPRLRRRARARGRGRAARR